MYRSMRKQECGHGIILWSWIGYPAYNSKGVQSHDMLMAQKVAKRQLGNRG